MSKLAIAEAIPWNLSISLVSILLKNLVLIGLGFGALRLSSGHKKESVNFCLNGGSGLPKSQNKKAHGYTVSISAFSLGLEIVQISIHLKSKNALYQKITNVYFFLLIFNKVWFLSIFTSAKVQKNPIVRR